MKPKSFAFKVAVVVWWCVAFIAFASYVGHAQTPAKPALKQFSDPAPKPDLIAEALKAEADATAAFDAAKARLDAAQANTRAVLFREMGEQGIKPSECAVDTNPFACISRDQSGKWIFAKKAEAAKK